MTLEMNTENEEKMAQNEVCLVSKGKKTHKGVREDRRGRAGQDQTENRVSRKWKQATVSTPKIFKGNKLNIKSRFHQEGNDCHLTCKSPFRRGKIVNARSGRTITGTVGGVPSNTTLQNYDFPIILIGIH